MVYATEKHQLAAKLSETRAKVDKTLERVKAKDVEAFEKLMTGPFCGIVDDIIAATVATSFLEGLVYGNNKIENSSPKNKIISL